MNLSSTLKLKKTARWLFLMFLLVLTASCKSEVEPTALPVLAFSSPANQIGFHTTLTLLSEDDPTHAHWVGHFGASVDIDGDVLVAGEPYWGRPPGEGKGFAYVFRKTPQGEWQFETTLASSDRNSGLQIDQHFGEVIALQGTTIVVGAPGADNPIIGDDTGAVFIFEYDGDTWVESQKLVSNRPKSGARFGSMLALDGDLLVVAGSPDAGVVHIFRRESHRWREMSQIPVPPAPEVGPPYVFLDLYGNALALSTVTQYDLEATDPQALRRTGIVTIYELIEEQWQQVFQTVPQEASLYRMSEGPYGLPISLGGANSQANLLAIGKPGFPDSGRERGSVLIYERGADGWVPQAEFILAPGEKITGAFDMVSPNPGATFFGAWVEFEGSRLAVISTFANTVYIFEPQEAGWDYLFRITPGQIGDTFQRRTAAMSSDQLLLGSPGELGGGYIFVFDVAPEPTPTAP